MAVNGDIVEHPLVPKDLEKAAGMLPEGTFKYESVNRNIIINYNTIQ